MWHLACVGTCAVSSRPLHTSPSLPIYTPHLCQSPIAGLGKSLAQVSRRCLSQRTPAAPSLSALQHLSLAFGFPLLRAAVLGGSLVVWLLARCLVAPVLLRLTAALEASEALHLGWPLVYCKACLQVMGEVGGRCIGKIRGFLCPTSFKSKRLVSP